MAMDDVALEHVRAAPKDSGTIVLIARRPRVGEREVIERAELSTEHGLVGDSWPKRPSRKTGVPNPEQQVTIMSSRAIAAIVPERAGWVGAGDQLYVDFDLSAENTPPGTRLQIGTATVEVSPHPHLGCAKFTKRFGSAATKWVNSDEGKRLNLRGVNAQVVVAGDVRTGDVIRKLATG